MNTRPRLQRVVMMATSHLELGQKRPRLYCEHCKQSVSNSTYYRHRARFFQEETKEWTTGDRADAGAADSGSDSSIEWSDCVAGQELLQPEAVSPFKQGKKKRAWFIVVVRRGLF